jgi:ABC-type nitrate/sulfonate/bicarbonate transport system substrate-binding protein
MGRWLTLVALVLCAAGARAEETLGVNAFSGANNLPLLVAQHEGMFQRRGLQIVVSHPKGSVDQIKGLVDGKYEVLLTALDNVMAYHDGHGEVDLGGPLDLVAFMGMDSGFLTLVAAPGTKDVAALKGKTMAVDALTTGFSFALEALLARGGVPKDGVRYVAFGSSGARWAALSDGRAQAALLNMPLDLVAADKGFVRLETVAGTLGHYQALVAAVRESWAKAHRGALQSFVDGYREGVRWVLVPAHKQDALAILRQEMPDLPAPALDRVYARLVDRREGMQRSLAVDPKGAAMVLALRARYGGGAGGDWHRYVDSSFLKR